METNDSTKLKSFDFAHLFQIAWSIFGSKLCIFSGFYHPETHRRKIDSFYGFKESAVVFRCFNVVVITLLDNTGKIFTQTG